MGKRISATTRAAVAAATSIALTFGMGGIVLATTADAATSYVASSAVNVRSGPSTSHKVIGVLGKGVATTGTATSSGWVKVSFKGGTGYVYGSYLKKSADSDTTHTTKGKATSKVTTTSVNLRSAPNLDSSVITVLAKGTTVNTTGRTSGDFTEVTVDGKARWLYTAYLTTAGSASSSLPAIKYRAKTTALLAMRKTPSITAASSGDLKVGTTVAITGTHQGSYSQIVYQGTVVWILSGYLSATGDGPTPPSLPTSAGKRYVTANELYIRATSAADGAVVDTVTKGTVLLVTGTVTNGRTQVIYGGALRWASSSYLSSTKPSSGSSSGSGSGSLGSESLDRTNAYAHAIVREIRAKFPQIKTIYGWRMHSDYSSDHPSGRALDVMIPKYSSSSGKTLGDSIARYLQDNHKRLHVHYLIWRQRNWNVERNTNPTSGWRKMSDRGGATANHYDHVHISVYKTP